ncbi:MAG: hypothetical protein Kow00120_06880 [Anaerolineae bacterium]
MGGFEEVILPRLWPDHLGVLMMVLAVWRFIIIGLALIVLFIQPEGSTLIVILLGVSGICMIMDSIWVFAPNQNGIGAVDWCLHNQNLGALLVRIISFALPLFVAGATKNRQARGWALLLAGLAMVYFFTTWFVFQRSDFCIVG